MRLPQVILFSVCEIFLKVRFFHMYCKTFKSTCRMLVALYTIILFTLFWGGFGAEMGICWDISFNIHDAIFPHTFRRVLILAPMIPFWYSISYACLAKSVWHKFATVCLLLFFRWRLLSDPAVMPTQNQYSMVCYQLRSRSKVLSECVCTSRVPRFKKFGYTNLLIVA